MSTQTSMPLAGAGRLGRLPGLAAFAVYASLLAAELAVWLVIVVGVGYAWLLPNLDFMGSYMGGYLLSTGQASRLYDVAAQLQVQALWAAPAQPAVPLYFLYPGWNAVFFAPFGALPYPWAFVLWEALNLAVTAACILGLVRVTARTRPEARTLALAALSFAPLAYALWQAQLSLLIWLGFTGGFLALRAGRDRQAGIWLTLALLKPQVLVLPLLALLLLAAGVPCAASSSAWPPSSPSRCWSSATGCPAISPTWPTSWPPTPRGVRPLARWRTGAGWSIACSAPTGASCRAA